MLSPSIVIETPGEWLSCSEHTTIAASVEGQAVFGVPAPFASDGRKEREDGSVSRRSARGRSRAEWEGDRSRNHRAFSSAFGSPESTAQRSRGDALERARLPAGASGIGAASVGRSGCVLSAAITRLIMPLCSALSRPRRCAPPSRSAALRALTAPARSASFALA